MPTVFVLEKGKLVFVGEMIAFFISLPPWGAMLQATVEFCKQNVEGTTAVAMFA